MIQKPYQCVRTYIGLPVSSVTLPRRDLFASFPSTLEWAGKMFSKKDGFHATIVRGEDVFAEAGLPTEIGEEKLIKLFNSFVEQKPITFESFQNDFRYATEDEKASIVIRCTLSNLEEFFQELNRYFGTKRPVQPAHVTLYTLQRNVGIHIPSADVMESLLRLHLAELEAAFKTISIDL